MILILTPGHSLVNSSSSSSDPVRSDPCSSTLTRLGPLIASNKQFGAVLTKRQRHEKVEMEVELGWPLRDMYILVRIRIRILMGMGYTHD